MTESSVIMMDSCGMLSDFPLNFEFDNERNKISKKKKKKKKFLHRPAII
jgi:hypothetical protein